MKWPRLLLSSSWGSKQPCSPLIATVSLMMSVSSQELAEAKVTNFELLVEVRLVIELKVVLRENRPARNVQIFPECVHEQVELIANAQERPIFVEEAPEERLPRTHVNDVSHREGVWGVSHEPLPMFFE